MTTDAASRVATKLAKRLSRKAVTAAARGGGRRSAGAGTVRQASIGADTARSAGEYHGMAPPTARSRSGGDGLHSLRTPTGLNRRGMDCWQPLPDHGRGSPDMLQPSVSLT